MSTLTARDRYSLLRSARMLEGRELENLRRETERRRQEVRTAVPYRSWAGFLQMKAEAGDEMVLAILRSRKEEIAPEASPPRPSEAASSGVDAGGTILFTLPSGGLVRESAREITFSAYNAQARAVAEKMARLKFGRQFSLQQNKIYRAAHQEQARERDGGQERAR